jgi:phage tail sheath protein FI
MAVFLQSPGVQIVEKDASLVVTGVSTTVGGTVGTFQWGPVMSPMLISNEADLVNIFGKPDNTTFASFFSAANFLSYTSSLWVTRAETANKNSTSDGMGVLIGNIADYEAGYADGQGTYGTFAARYPGTLGNSIVVSIADSATFATWAYKNQFTTAPGTSDFAAAKGGSNDELHIIVIDSLGKFTGVPGSTLEKYEFVSKASDAISFQGLSNYYANVIRNRSSYVYMLDHAIGANNWGSLAFGVTFDSLVDDNVATSLTITAASVTANVATLSFATEATKPFVVGQSITIAGVTPTEYNGVFTVTACTVGTVKFALVGTPTNATVFGTVADTSVNLGYDFTYTLAGGIDENTATNASLQLAWDMFVDIETFDISLFFTGNADTQLSKYVVDNIAEVRKDCIVCISLCTPAGGPVFTNSATKLTDASTFKTAIGNSNYTVIDSGYKYMYDKYNDKYRWIALNPDTAGLCAKVDATQDTWQSPAGLTKGQIRGAIKLAWNPNQSHRDTLYKLAINPVVSFIGQGTILYGDKTATLKPSAFDRINVRRLFLVLEKSIGRSAKFQLFELNDATTRQQFVSSIEPFLRDVQGRRGIEAFQVICDETNNTASVISTNEFRGTILIRPNYSISFITLTFTAVGPSVSFETAAAV